MSQTEQPTETSPQPYEEVLWWTSSSDLGTTWLVSLLQIPRPHRTFITMLNDAIYAFSIDQ